MNYLTISQYAARHRVNRSLVHRWIRDGRLRAVRFGTGCWLIRENEPRPAPRAPGKKGRG